MKDSNVHYYITDNLVFVEVNPTASQGNEIIEGTNELLCLRKNDGGLLWSKTIPFHFGAHFSFDRSKTEILCGWNRQVFILDAVSGKIRDQLQTESVIRGTSWWGDDRFVLCFNELKPVSKRRFDANMDFIPVGKQKANKIFHIYKSWDMSLLDDFCMELPSGTPGTIRIVGNIARIGNYGVDLKTYKQVWEKKGAAGFYIHDDIYNYYCPGVLNEWSDAESVPTKVFGRIDLRTGQSGMLYREPLALPQEWIERFKRLKTDELSPFYDPEIFKTK